MVNDTLIFGTPGSVQRLRNNGHYVTSMLGGTAIRGDIESFHFEAFVP
jgi:hypothetical protein